MYLLHNHFSGSPKELMDRQTFNYMWCRETFSFYINLQEKPRATKIPQLVNFSDYIQLLCHITHRYSVLSFLCQSLLDFLPLCFLAWYTSSEVTSLLLALSTVTRSRSLLASRLHPRASRAAHDFVMVFYHVARFVDFHFSQS